MKYTIKAFKKDFPDDNACLEYLFKHRFPHLVCPACNKNTAFYRIKGRKQFACQCGYQISPTANTIFHKSDTSLTDWFFAIYLMSKAKNGISAVELQGHLGCTYKTAWRIGHKIRLLMKDNSDMLSGTVEADEAYIGGKKRRAERLSNKGMVMAVVQRKGKAKAVHIEDGTTSSMLRVLRDNVKMGTRVITDETTVYKPNKIYRLGMLHDKINHSKEEWVRGDVFTNTVEGFFSQFKRSLDGTYHSVSLKHLQSYADQFAFLYNHRASAFSELLGRLTSQPYLRGQKNPLSVEVRVS